MTERDNLPLRGRPSRGYEVWFLTLTDRRSGQGFWIRSTVDGSGGAAWFARFHPAEPALTFGIHRGTQTADIARDRFEVRVADTVMTSGAAQGGIDGGGHRVTWSLTWPTGDETYRLLPDWAYRPGVSVTKPYAPNVDARFSGTITIDGASLELADAPGQQGHLAGSGHAERWAWAHCGDFDGDRSVIQVVTAATRRGPLTTPFVTSAGVLWDGRWIRLSETGRRRPFGLGSWKVDAANRRYRLTGRIEAPTRDLLRARYLDPDGSERWCHNSEIASCRLALFERSPGGFEEIALFESRGTTHAEWAGLTPARAVEREHVDVTAR